MKTFAAILSLIVPGSLLAQSGSVLNRIYEYDNIVVETANIVGSNPAFVPILHTVSLSSAAISGQRYAESEAIDMRMGDGDRFWQAGAQTYLKPGNSTLWGHAWYKNGRKTYIRYNETADFDLIYPYLTADTIGGDLQYESYSLAGGASLTMGKWQLGGELGYDAGLYYRNVDPRPKDVTGLLEMSVGASYQLDGSYMLGLKLGAKKYKQTCDIMFVSEAGKTPVYHPTGMGNIYNRFTGASSTSHYTGYEYGVAVGLLPTHLYGWMAGAQYTRYQFKKILTDLNKLPLCRAWQNDLYLEAGYMHENWSSAFNLRLARRHGIENIFGDAAGASYPQIGSLEMYAANLTCVGGKGAYRLNISPASKIDIKAEGGIAHVQQLYVDPYSEELDNCAYGELGADYKRIMGDKWYADLSMHGTLSQHAQSISPGVLVARELSAGYAIGLALKYGYVSYKKGISANKYMLSVNLYF